MRIRHAPASRGLTWIQASRKYWKYVVSPNKYKCGPTNRVLINVFNPYRLTRRGICVIENYYSSSLESRICYALIDDGSTITSINQRLLRELNIHGQFVEISLKGITYKEAINTTCEKVTFTISGQRARFDILTPLKHLRFLYHFSLSLKAMKLKKNRRIRTLWETG